MDLAPYVAQLREDLATAAAAGDEQTRRTAALLGAAIEPAVRLALFHALADLAAEVTAALDDHTVDLRLDGRDVRVTVSGGTVPGGWASGGWVSGGSVPGGTVPGGTVSGGTVSGGTVSGGTVPGGAGAPGPRPDGPDAGPAWGRPPYPDAGDISRVTLRIVEQIKNQAEQAAQSQGVSLNTWVSQAVQGALSGADRLGGRGPGQPGPDQGRRLRGWVQG